MHVAQTLEATSNAIASHELPFQSAYRRDDYLRHVAALAAHGHLSTLHPGKGRYGNQLADFEEPFRL